MKSIIKSTLSALALLSGIAVSAQSIYPGQHEGKIIIPVSVNLKAESFDLKDVRLLKSRFKDNMDRDSAWIASIHVNRLLHSFRNNAGVYSDKEGGYKTVKKFGGWEQLDCDLRGHTTGHLLSAYALMYASTGNNLFKQKGDSLVSGLSEVQAVLKSGYISAFPENLIDRNIAGKSVWAPWYTLHKILSGLIDQYLYSNNAQAFDIAIRFSDWAYNKLMHLSEDQRILMIKNEFGGINESFYNLYSITGDKRNLELAKFFYHNEVIDPLRYEYPDLGTKHANTFIPKVIAEARNYELSGDAVSRDVAFNFWNEMIDNHAFAPGCVSDRERLFKPTEMSKHVSGYTGETCCTYNLLKLSRHLFCWTASSKVADYYERALYNHVLGQQDPESGMMAYFLPLKSGSHKVYSTPENSFWCCVGSGFENHAKYTESIYYKNNDGIFVNLFIPSKVDWKEKGLQLTQTTSFPESETIIIEISSSIPTFAKVYLRYPSWSKNAIVSVNGKRIKINVKNGEYITLAHTWKDGDKITATFPMNLTFEATNDNPNCGALVYGPIVLAGERGTDGMKDPAPFSNPALYNDYYTYDFHIPATLSDSLDADENNLNKHVVKDTDSLTFRTPNGDVIRPLYDIHRQRYVVYWNLNNPKK